MATINIGSLRFEWKGAYNGSTAYAVDDVVSYNGSSYICILASTGNLPTNTTYFQPMATKGSDGTDVGTTLTTQGDILYRDGSGLQRLAAGTSGQVLQTGGSGANPSWGTVSSDYVKLASIDSTSGEVSFDGFFTSDYRVYDLIVHQMQHNSTDWGRLYVNTGGSKQTASNYRMVGDGASRDSSTDSYIKYSKWNEAFGIFHYWGGPARGTIRIFDPLDTTTEKFMHCTASSYQNDTKIWQESSVNVYHSNAAISGITIGSSGTLNVCQADLYGIKT